MSKPLTIEAQRSLWTDAAARLLRNKAAVASLFVLGLLLVAALLGPSLTGHPYDKVYTEYVKAEPQLSAYPRAEQIEPAVTRIAARMRARVEATTINADTVTVVLAADRAIDVRSLAYFERTCR